MTRLPDIAVCRDPDDDYLLAMAVAGDADFLLTGDKRDLISLAVYGRTGIVAVRAFLAPRDGLP